jgi:hypothetical protein
VHRDRLRCYLTTTLRHWQDLTVPNLKLYLTRWKHFLIQSYAASILTDMEEEILQGKHAYV